ncbi:unnamed protein product [Haemonchus placei]|uniref:Protein artichoke n=1 Tax=Haemonchus placei TaxID=6290 RepID=A0A0N4W5M9_HAEPC|nr:unnamed protein product [Haemonchus placei]
MRLFVAAVVAVQAIIVDTRQAGSVPGCPDLDVLEAEVDTSADFLNNLLLCFCKVQDKGKVDISCLYGSSLEHLEKATEAVKKANFSTNKISFQHTEFADSGLPSFVELAPALTSLEIRECTNFEPLVVPENTFKGLETTLKNLIIDSCGLKLNYLDLSGNFITTVDAGSFEPLQKLETLVFGERNYINDSVVEAIVTLKSLKTLDLSRADGIFEPPTEIFEALPHLEGLKLSGCSISSLEPGTFATLKNLKELDLRVNLIQNVSAYAFDGLSELNRLSLAGNYIRSIEKEIWTGLNKLKEIDLGWNEIKQLSPDAFLPLADNLETLNIRHNPLKDVPPSGLKNLRSLFLSECPIENLGPELLKDYNALETLDVAKCNLTELKPEALASQKHSLKNFHIQRNLFKTIDPKRKPLEPNPTIQVKDLNLFPVILAIEDRFKTAAKEGKEFLLANANDTLCDRPYTLRRQPLLDVNSTELQPDLFVGTETNDTLFKEEPRRELYDLNTANDPKNAMKEQEGKVLVDEQFHLKNSGFVVDDEAKNSSKKLHKKP